FIVVPLLAPVALTLGIDLVWFGVLLAVNMQTSFMHPPFGFALFYLRSVAPEKEYTDRITRKTIAPVTTMQIYWGAVPFVLIQVVMVGLIIAFPGIVSSGLDKEAVYDMDKIRIQMEKDMLKQDSLGTQPEAGVLPGAPDAGAIPMPEPSPQPAETDKELEELFKQKPQGQTR
ncbi:MAG TPA: TRAP transporter large permease subunit, partial [Ramlibacter sp.]